MPDRGVLLILGPNDLDDVEPTGVFQQAVRLEEGQRGTSETCLPMGVDCFGRTTVLFAATGFHLDEDDRLAFGRQDIDLAVALPMPGEENLVTESTKISSGVLFTALAKRERPKPLP